MLMTSIELVFFFQAEDGIRDYKVTGVQTCALPISRTFGLLGLTQSVLVGKNWGVDVGVDQSTTFAGSDSKRPPRINPSYPIAAGSGSTSTTGTPGVFGLS